MTRARRLTMWTLIAACGLIVCLGLFSLCVGPWLHISNGRTTISLNVDASSARLMYDTLSDDAAGSWDVHANLVPGTERWRWLPYRYWHTAQYGTRTGVFGEFSLPLYIPLLLLGASIAYLWFRRGGSPGHCRECGYDLAALPEGAPCPECGKGRPPADAR